MIATQSIESPENGTWDFASNGWSQLFGSFPKQGISIEWHDFEAPHTIPWEKSFHDDSLEICLNLEGRGEISRKGNSGIEFREQTVGFYNCSGNRLKGFRSKGQRHSFLTIEVSKKYLKKTLQGTTGLRPLVKSFLDSRSGNEIYSEVQPLRRSLQEVVSDLREPHVPEPARPLWYQCKTTEILAQLLFEENRTDELFCVRQKRVARERIDKVKLLLQEHFEEPLRLRELSKTIGCSPFYLSRIFSQETGTTIPKYLRQLRIERAAELLKSGNYNVTEAAVEVGYSSVSHFTKAFHEMMGCCPGLYPLPLSKKI